MSFRQAARLSLRGCAAGSGAPGSWRGAARLLGRLLLAAGLAFQVPVYAADGPAGASSSIVKEDINPEAATGLTRRELVRASHYMAVSANPLATRAGAAILAQGGNAVDAAIAMQMVLTLVEPQSSGIGGGAFLVMYDPKAGNVRTFDGRETAPAAARSDRFMSGGKAMAFQDAVNNGRSVGVPGVLAMLEMVHRGHGRLAWPRLFAPAIELAEQGFAVSPRLHGLLQKNEHLRAQPAAAAYFYDSQGEAWPVGYVLRNPALAMTLRAIAAGGAQAFYKGAIADDIVQAVTGHPHPGDMTQADLAGYQAKERPALCMPYKAYELCGMPPPSSGPLAVMQMLGILQHTAIAGLEPDSLASVHLFAEAGRLAYADRDFYVADPDFEKVPVDSMLDPRYLALRADLIQPGQSMGRAPPGDPAGMRAVRGRDGSPELPSTSHMVAADRDGMVVSMTSSIETAFGSKIFVDGFLLNNELTDFSLVDVDAQGRQVANRVEPGKRPRSSMAPMVVLKEGKPYMAIGSPGGAAIINYVAKTLLGVLDWKLDIQQAIDLPNRGSRNRFTELEKGTSLHALAGPLRAMGHEVREIEFPSGLHGVVLTPEGLQGGADPRREGVAAGG